MEKRELTDALYRELVALETTMEAPNIIIDKTGDVKQINITNQVYYLVGRILMEFRNSYSNKENFML